VVAMRFGARWLLVALRSRAATMINRFWACLTYRGIRLNTGVESSGRGTSDG
jgi:hypothetical protein